MQIHMTQEELNDIVSQNMTCFRQRFQLDILTLADALDIEPIDYIKMETGENTVSLLTMNKIALFYDATIDAFCHLEDAPKPRPDDDTDDPNVAEELLKMSSDEKTAILLARYWNIPVREVVSEVAVLRKEHDELEDEYFPGDHKIEEVPFPEIHDPEDESEN